MNSTCRDMFICKCSTRAIQRNMKVDSETVHRRFFLYDFGQYSSFVSSWASNKRGFASTVSSFSPNRHTCKNARMLWVWHYVAEILTPSETNIASENAWRMVGFLLRGHENSGVFTRSFRKRTVYSKGKKVISKVHCSNSSSESPTNHMDILKSRQGLTTNKKRMFNILVSRWLINIVSKFP